ncbi:M15 family metallopeptidase [Caloramator proteoclasticus]|uniref:D-alanyl-D-alanine dipeptidase n=1 Tax=Caloramator proteoclasticus DSM 10124 TaxID=1121262 RepID=A0A1M4YS29_9CLOT|nr:M15 family metallopeptidase [Caloramator proteoclasticus]SHF08523.1 D-alanyl-D-alanine dipeptidase [Caloramator proteoclasticus DSM 10124]
MRSDFDLVDVSILTDKIIFDIRYATDRNFFKRRFYIDERCLLRYGTAKKLIKVNEYLLKLGFKLKVWDAYRPLSVQRIMWEAVKNEDYIAPPWRGSIHNRGAAVDVTLVDINNKEVEMPSDFDDFSERASINYSYCSIEAINNREILAEAMMKNGFRRIESEWWHFYDEEFSKYEIL